MGDRLDVHYRSMLSEFPTFLQKISFMCSQNVTCKKLTVDPTVTRSSAHPPPLTFLRLLTSLSARRSDQSLTHQGGSEEQSLGPEADRHRNVFLSWLWFCICIFWHWAADLVQFDLETKIKGTIWFSLSFSLSVCPPLPPSGLPSPGWIWNCSFVVGSIACARLKR